MLAVCAWAPRAIPAVALAIPALASFKKSLRKTVIYFPSCRVRCLRMWPAAEAAGSSQRVRLHDPAVHHHQAGLPKVPNRQTIVESEELSLTIHPYRVTDQSPDR